MRRQGRNNQGQSPDDPREVSGQVCGENEDSEFFFFIEAPDSGAPRPDERKSRDAEPEVAIDESGAFFLTRED
ncbi:MAG: hypothetical protein QMD32_06515 [Smithellaceae bacterium]|nr:hypothetical protein [Smithellaceae bacterium]